MTKTRYESESHRCSKIHCSNLMSSKHHPIWYSNGLCEQHFFEIDLSKNEIDRKLNKKSKVKKTKSINHQYQPLRDDIRQTREIFNGHQWQIIEQKIDRESEKLTHQPNVNSIENNLLKMFELIQNYQIIQNELKD